jgi:hypothetical protein
MCQVDFARLNGHYAYARIKGALEKPLRAKPATSKSCCCIARGRDIATS